MLKLSPKPDGIIETWAPLGEWNSHKTVVLRSPAHAVTLLRDVSRTKQRTSRSFARTAISRACPSSQDPQKAHRRMSAGPGSVREKARRQMSAGQFFEFDLWLVLPAGPEPGEKMGLGSSPRSLSPNTGIWRPASPVECRWLSVSRRCTGLHERLHSVSVPQRNRPTVSPPPACRVRLLSPAFAHLASVRPPDPVQDAFENECIPHHFREVGICNRL